MKDIPMFTSEYGVASLFLQQIPYTEIARIKILASEMPAELLAECVGFCKACGAEKIHCCGHDYLEKYPLVTEVWEMIGQRPAPCSASLFPVQMHTIAQWKEIANNRMRNVDGAAYISDRDCAQILKNGTAYFVHENNELLGIGQVEDDKIRLVASVVAGRGEDVFRTLAMLVPDENVRVCVASTNFRAISLYERLGFVKTKVVAKWHKII